MKTALDITTHFYKILNKSELTDLLNGGRIYKEVRPTNSTENDIVINVNFLKTDYKTGVNYGKANINVYVKAQSNGSSNSAFFKIITDKILELFKRINFNSGSFYFSVYDTQIYNELNQKEWFYFNLKMDVQIN